MRRYRHVEIMRQFQRARFARNEDVWACCFPCASQAQSNSRLILFFGTAYGWPGNGRQSNTARIRSFSAGLRYCCRSRTFVLRNQRKPPSQDGAVGCVRLSSSDMTSLCQRILGELGLGSRLIVSDCYLLSLPRQENKNIRIRQGPGALDRRQLVSSIVDSDQLRFRGKAGLRSWPGPVAVPLQSGRRLVAWPMPGALSHG